MPWEALEAGLWVGLCLALTEIVRTALPIGERWIPILPAIVGLVIAFPIAALEPYETTREFWRISVTNAARIAPSAAYIWKVWHTTLRGEGLKDDNANAR